jgi:hypothetical protein
VRTVGDDAVVPNLTPARISERHAS